MCANACSKTLPDGTLVLTRDELIAQERAYFLSTKPIGIMMYISMLIAYLVGSVILIQVCRPISPPASANMPC